MKASCVKSDRTPLTKADSTRSKLTGQHQIVSTSIYVLDKISSSQLLTRMRLVRLFGLLALVSGKVGAKDTP